VLDGISVTNHAVHETVEIAHGFSDWFECGFYLFTRVRSGRGWDIGNGCRARPPAAGTTPMTRRFSRRRAD
jgi:hypothetical protein